MKTTVGDNIIGVVLMSFKWLEEEWERISLERSGENMVIQVVKFKQQLLLLTFSCSYMDASIK